MKKRKRWKWIAPILVLIVCVPLWIFGIRQVNDQYEQYLPERVIVDKNDTASFGQNYFDKASEIIDGYSIRVNDAQMIPTEEYLESHGMTMDYYTESARMDIPDYIYEVNITAFNQDNDQTGKTGIDFELLSLQGTTYNILVDDELYYAANPDMNDSIKLSLRPGSQYDICLPYPIYSQQYRKNQFSYDPPMLLISEFPQKMLLKTE